MATLGHDRPFLSVRDRYDKGLISIQSLAVYRLFDQQERYERLRAIVNTGTSFDIPAFEVCLPGVPLCGVSVVDHTCSLILKLHSLDELSVGSATILADFEAQGEPL